LRTRVYFKIKKKQALGSGRGKGKEKGEIVLFGEQRTYPVNEEGEKKRHRRREVSTLSNVEEHRGDRHTSLQGKGRQKKRTSLNALPRRKKGKAHKKGQLVSNPPMFFS